MDEKRAARLLQAGLDTGADFAELFVEETRFGNVALRDRRIESAIAGTEFGIGVRLCFGTEVLYGHTSRDDDDLLLRLIRELSAARPGVASVGVSRPLLALASRAIAESHAVRIDPRTRGQDGKLALLRRCDEAARAVSAHIAQVTVSAFDKVSEVAIFNSEGLSVRDRRTWARASVSVVAQRDGERYTGTESPGLRRGLEFFEEGDFAGKAREAAERAVRMLDSGYAPAGEMPVVLGGGFGGVIFHEACGHPLETEAVRRNATPFAGKVGEAIAHSAVTAIDDGTIPNAWGSLNIDDEGMPTQRTVLIENGVLRSYMSDRVGALQCGVERTGSGRRENYKYAPVSRMRNTFIAAGSDSRDDMIASIGHGLYAAKMGGGSVNPATGEFNFAVEEGYRIEDGRLGAPVRGATLIGKGHEILPRISMVGRDLELAAGMCGASSGHVPVSVGQPSLKVDCILVGGRG